jgi:hypothetical protein
LDLNRARLLRTIARVAALACLAAVSSRPLVAAPASGDAGDTLILSFVTVGDSRQDPTKPDPTTKPVSKQDQKFLQNTKAWSRIMREVQAQRPDFLFFNGDMIMGYGKAAVPSNVSSVSAIVSSDLVAFERQYGFWRGMVTSLLETGTYVVPVPGNHEVQCSDKVSASCSKPGKNAEIENENAWRANMGDLILDTDRLKGMFPDWATRSYFNASNHPASGDGDGISTDQTQLSFSFDFRDSHFAVINTDAYGVDAQAPVNWLNRDLAEARGRGARHFFVFGHKPAYTYFYEGSDFRSYSGIDNNDVNRYAFWQVIEADRATYFCGHEHIFRMSQPLKDSGGSAWQVIVGAGGSPFDAAKAGVPTDRMYSWVNVQVYASGKVVMTAYGFNDQYGPTQVITSVPMDR